MQLHRKFQNPVRIIQPSVSCGHRTLNRFLVTATNQALLVNEISLILLGIVEHQRKKVFKYFVRLNANANKRT